MDRGEQRAMGVNLGFGFNWCSSVGAGAGALMKVI